MRILDDNNIVREVPDRRVTVDTSEGGFSLSFILFVVIKIAGTALADWSWWWVFIPFVPIISLLLKAVGL